MSSTPINPSHRRTTRRAGWLIGFTITLVVLLLLLLPKDLPFIEYLHVLEAKTYDMRLKARGSVAPTGRVVIAAIDERSIEKIGRWPWPRTKIAELISRLHGYGVKVVALDLVFNEPETPQALSAVQNLRDELDATGEPLPRGVSAALERIESRSDHDAVLARAIRESGNVVLGYFFRMPEPGVRRTGPGRPQDLREAIAGSGVSMVKTTGGDPPPVAWITAAGVTPNLPSFHEAAAGAGHLNFIPDADGTFRAAPLVIRLGDTFYPSLDLSAFRASLENPHLVLEMDEGGILGVRLGALFVPTDAFGRVYANFRGPTRTFKHLSAVDILEGKLSKEALDGKIVLVGATATGVYDHRVTPVDRVYPGVEIHATVLDNFLAGDFIHRPLGGIVADMAAVLLLGLLLSMALPRLGPLPGLFLAAVVTAGYLLAAHLLLVRAHVWIGLLYPAVTGLFVYLGITVFKYLTEEREKKKTRRTLEQYVAPFVAAELLEHPEKLALGGEARVVTVLFSDIRGFTALSEKLSPTALVSLLNEYFEPITEIIFRQRGLLDKYVGDAIMAFFGPPMDEADHPFRAAHAAVGIVRQIPSLNEGFRARGLPPISAGVGLNSGEVIVGNMGSSKRFNYTVIGDEVNLASRLEGLTRIYGVPIIASESVLEGVGGRLMSRELDAVRVKGKAQPVRIFELIGEDRPPPAWTPFGEGLAGYRARKWDQALRAFAAAKEAGDPAAQAFLTRCRNLQAAPPPESWDGVYEFKEK